MENAPLVKFNKEYENYVLAKIDEYNSNGKKTIALFCDTFYPCIDGVIVVLDNYAEHLSKYYNVVVVVPKHHGLVSKQPNYLLIGVKSKFFKFVNYDLAFPRLDGFVKKALNKLNLSLIHSHSPFTLGGLALKTARKKHIPFIMTMHSQYKQDFEKHVKSKAIVNMLVKNIMKVFNGADEVWTMHNKTAAVLTSYGYNGNFYFVPNATHLPVPADRQKLIDEFDAENNVTSSTPVFLFLGRLVALKNIFFIVDALEILDKRGMDFQMYFIGTGPDAEKLKKTVEAKHLENKIHLLGRIDDRYVQSKYYQRADLFLFPSKYDSSSLVQIEAALHQTPGVYIRGSATAETITENVNGYLSDDDVTSYANTIENALKDKETLKKISQNAFEQIYVSYEMVSKIAHERYEYLMNNSKNADKK